jgi:mannose-6-phosphate isomerase-like protein (cupin superfamily)
MTLIDGGGLVVLPGEGRYIDVGRFGATVLADAAQTEGAFSLIETAETGVGGAPPLHVHRDCAESFVVLAGRYRMHLAGRDFECPPGAFVYVPKGMVHTFASLETASRKLNLFTPAGMIGYFDELAEGIQRGLRADELDSIADSYAMEVVGPIPPGYVTAPTGTGPLPTSAD